MLYGHFWKAPTMNSLRNTRDCRLISVRDTLVGGFTAVRKRVIAITGICTNRVVIIQGLLQRRAGYVFGILIYLLGLIPLHLLT